MGIGKILGGIVKEIIKENVDKETIEKGAKIVSDGAKKVVDTTQEKNYLIIKNIYDDITRNKEINENNLQKFNSFNKLCLDFLTNKDKKSYKKYSLEIKEILVLQYSQKEYLDILIKTYSPKPSIQTLNESKIIKVFTEYVNSGLLSENNYYYLKELVVNKYSSYISKQECIDNTKLIDRLEKYLIDKMNQYENKYNSDNIIKIENK